MINLLIAGYHGFGNCGDDATLQAMTVNIRNMASDVNITALSYQPELTKTEYSIESVQRFKILQVLRAIKKSDIVLCGGGTLLQNITSTRSLLYYLAIIKAAEILGKKVMLYANGIGPVSGKTNRKLIKNVVNGVDIITLREEMSARELESIGVTKPEIFVTADPAFTLEPISENRATEFLKAESVPLDKDIIGVSVRSWANSFSGEDYVKSVAETCDKFVREGKVVLLIPMQFPKDVDISMKVMAQMSERAYILSREYSPSEILGIIGRVKVLLSMRLHTLIFAAVRRIPMAGIIYDPKIQYYLSLLEMPCGGDIRTEKLSSDRLYNTLNDIFNNYENYKKRLNSSVTVLEKSAKRNDKLLKKQLDAIRDFKEDRRKD